MNADSRETWVGYELVLMRVIEAPRTLVFKMWTDPKHLAQWWGPHGFTTPVCDWDARHGGAIRVEMRGPDGISHPMAGTYQEIVEPEKIVFMTAVPDATGKVLFEIRNTVTFTEQAGKTTQILKARVVSATAEAAKYLGGMEIGWSQSLERLADYAKRVHKAEKRS